MQLYAQWQSESCNAYVAWYVVVYLQKRSAEVSYHCRSSKDAAVMLREEVFQVATVGVGI